MCLPGQPPRTAADPAAPPAAAPDGAPGAAGVPVSAADAVAMAHAGPGVPGRRGYGVAAGRGAGRVPARVRAGRVAAHRGAGRGAGRVHLLGRLPGRRAGHGKGVAWVSARSQRRGGRRGRLGRAWPPTLPRRGAGGRGVSASWAREICAWTAKLPAGKRAGRMRFCWRPRRAARSWRIWPAGREMAAAAPSPTTTAMGGFGIGGCGWTGPSTTRAGSKVINPAVHRRAGRGPGRVQQETGPEDTRTVGQRHHDGLEEACPGS